MGEFKVIVSNEMRLKLNIGSAQASISITFKLDEARAEQAQADLICLV
jgi:hypothetical protein